MSMLDDSGIHLDKYDIPATQTHVGADFGGAAVPDVAVT